MFEKLTTESVLSQIPSGVGLDIAKNHTGVCIWDGSSIEVCGFSLPEYDSTDQMAEAKMRRHLRDKLTDCLGSRFFEYLVVEDVYGGENFDTVRKLIALNTVIDDLILDGVVRVNNFYRNAESVWMKGLRLLYKAGNKLSPKYEVQEVLGYLGFDFYLRNKDLTPTELKGIFFEDICDATGMLLGLVADKFVKRDEVERSSLKRVTLSGIKLMYFETDDEVYNLPRLSNCDFIHANLNFSSIERSVVSLVNQYPNSVVICPLPSSKLGVFGIKNGFKFFEGNSGVLAFYNKKGLIY